MDIQPDVIGAIDTEPGERWRQMNNYSNSKYRFDPTWYISSFGRTWDSENGRSLPRRDNEIHNQFVCRYHNGSPNKTYVFSIHLMVGGIFLPKVAGKSFSFHKDFDYKNNNLSNLERCTNAEYNLSLPGTTTYKGIAKAKQEADIPQHKRYYIVQVNETPRSTLNAALQTMNLHSTSLSLSELCGVTIPATLSATPDQHQLLEMTATFLNNLNLIRGPL